MLKRTKPILSDLGTYLTKVPSTQHRPKATSSILYHEGNTGEEIRRITVTSSSNESSTDNLGSRLVMRGEASLHPPSPLFTACF